MRALTTLLAPLAALLLLAHGGAAQPVEPAAPPSSATARCDVGPLNLTQSISITDQLTVRYTQHFCAKHE